MSGAAAGLVQSSSPTKSSADSPTGGRATNNPAFATSSLPKAGSSTAEQQAMLDADQAAMRLALDVLWQGSSQPAADDTPTSSELT